MEESHQASTSDAERNSPPKPDAPTSSSGSSSHAAALGEQHAAANTSKQEQEQQEQETDLQDDSKLPGKVVLGPPSFIEKLNRFKAQGLSRLGNDKLMKHATQADGATAEACV